MKVLLIALPEINILPEPETSSIRESSGCYPPLGLLYIAAYMMENSDHEVSVIDAHVSKFTYEQLEHRIKEINPDLVGIHATTFTLKDAILTAKIVKKINLNIHINIGGPHISIYPKETLLFPEVDSITMGEGEITFTELANYLEQKKDMKKVKGIAFKKRNKIMINESRGFIENLNELPFPKRTLLHIKQYYSSISKRKFLTTVISSRGCPYNCLFCFTKGRKFRERSPENVMAEIKECMKLGITEFEFFDDTFTVNPKRVMDISNLIIKENLKITWAIRARVDTVNLEMLRKLKKAGCVRINYGVEAGTNKILKLIRKGITLQQIRGVFKLTRKVGIETAAYFMIGHPTETKEQILQTIKFAKELKPDYCLFSIVVPYPDTDMYKMGLETGLYREDYWKKFAENPLKVFRPKVWTENFTEAELLDLLELSYKKFYLTPQYILKQIFKIRSFSEFTKYAKIARILINFKKQ
jgi:radical SAM superfamily enzyme YgiQ (UPF0313 family)